MFQINYVERNQKKISVKNALSPNFVIVQKTTKSQNLQHKKFNLPERCNFIVTFFSVGIIFDIRETESANFLYTNMPENTILKNFSTMDKAEIEDILEISRKQ